MKVTVRRSELVKGLKKVAAAVGSKEQLNVMSGIRIGAKWNVPAPHAIEDDEFGHVELAATDGTMQIRAYVPCNADSDGVACLPAKFLQAFAEALPDGEVVIETHDVSKATISGGECKYTLATLDAEAFPVMKEPDVSKGGRFAMGSAEFRELLRKVKYAAAKTEEGRRVLAGVNVCTTGSMIRMVATDGKRLSMVEHFFRTTAGGDKPKDVSVGTIPNKAVKEIYGLLGDESCDAAVGISTDGKKVRILTDGFEVVTKLFEDIYPNWTKVVPAKVAYTASVKRRAFLDELMRANASTVASDSHMVKMTFDKGVAVFEGRADDISKSKTKLAVGYEGEKAEFKINPALIEDVLTAIDDKDVTIGFDGSGKPLVVRCSIWFVAVVMPWRVG